MIYREITKVAVLHQKDFLHLKEAFPDWYKQIIQDDKFYNIGMKFLQNIRKRIQKRKNNELSPKLRIPTWKSDNDNTSYQGEQSPERSELENTYPEIPKENQPYKLRDTQELQIHNKFTEVQAVQGAVETCVSVIHSDHPMKFEHDKEFSFELPRYNPVPLFTLQEKNVPDQSISSDETQKAQTGSAVKLSGKFHSKTPSSFRSKMDRQNVYISERSKSNRISTWFKKLSIFKDLRKRFSVPEVKLFSLEKSTSKMSNTSNQESLSTENQKNRLHVSGKDSLRGHQNASPRSSFAHSPSFLIHEEEENEGSEYNRSPRASHSAPKKKSKKLSLRKNTKFMAKSIAIFV